MRSLRGPIPRLQVVLGLDEGMIREIHAAGARFIRIDDTDQQDSDLLRHLRALRSERSDLWMTTTNRVDVAIAAGIDGVHLTSGSIGPASARLVAGSRPFLIGVDVSELNRALEAVLDPTVDLIALNEGGDSGVEEMIARVRPATRKPLFVTSDGSREHVEKMFASGANGIIVRIGEEAPGGVRDHVRRLVALTEAA